MGDDVRRTIMELDVARVKRVYAGRPGCGCGCNGRYWDDARNIKRVVKEMKENVSWARRVSFDEDGAAVEGDRYLWAYFA